MTGEEKKRTQKQGRHRHLRTAAPKQVPLHACLVVPRASCRNLRLRMYLQLVGLAPGYMIIESFMNLPSGMPRAILTNPTALILLQISGPMTHEGGLVCNELGR